jgi:hypothetical protein
MESGYEIEPERIGRRTDRRRPLVAIVVAIVIVATVLVKPWAGDDAKSGVVRLTSVPADAVASPAATIADPQAADLGPAPDPTWPASRAATALATQTANQAEGALRSLVRHAGTWGVGNAGVGPRMLRDDPWTDWTPVDPEIVDGPPAHIAIWPGTDLCAAYPTIYDRPTLIAITMPRDVAPDRDLLGWWADDGRVASLDGSIVQVSPPGNRGISYLERVDRAPWPPGRYEFHVVVASGSVALTVCLTRRG